MNDINKNTNKIIEILIFLLMTWSCMTIILMILLGTHIWTNKPEKYNSTTNPIENINLTQREKNIIKQSHDIISKYEECDLITIIPEHTYLVDCQKNITITIPALILIKRKGRIGPEFTLDQYKQEAFREIASSSAKAVIYDDFLKEELKEIPSDAVIADIGTGYGGMLGGLSKIVPHGTIYATDLTENSVLFVNWKTLLYIRDFYYYKHDEENEKGSNSLTQIIPIIGTLEKTNLPPDSIDIVFMQNLHAFCKKPQNEDEKNIQINFLQSVIDSLKIDGQIIIIDSSSHPIPPHKNYEEFVNFFTSFENLKLVSEKVHPDNSEWFILRFIKTSY
jgi:SAM-dependent methyltransferase